MKKTKAIGLNTDKKTKSERRLSSIVRNEYLSREVFLSVQWCKYIFITGARGYGKTFLVMDIFLKTFFSKEGKDYLFYWLRLTKQAQEKLLSDNGNSLLDPALRRKYHIPLDAIKINKTRGTVHLYEKLFLTVGGLSVFYNDKGTTLFDKTKKIKAAMDEFNRETAEKNNFDIGKTFFGTMETLARDCEGINIFLMGNTIAAVSDLLIKFKFIPHKHGVFFLKSQNRAKAAIFNLPNSPKYTERRKRSVTYGLIDGDSSYSNDVENNWSLLTNKIPNKQTAVLVFSQDKKYTVYDGYIICKYKGESCREIAMRPFISDIPFFEKVVKEIVTNSRLRLFKFQNLVLQKEFEYYIDFYFPKVRK